MRHEVCLVAATGLVIALTARAEIVTVPADLNPGDEYRLAFITLGTTTALSPDIEFYNAFVTAQAATSPALATLATSWHAIGSTAAVSAKQNTDTDDSPPGANGVPIYRLDGVRIANNYDDLWDGSIQNPLYVAQEGTVLNTCCGTWTGTTSAGTAATGFELGSPSLLVVDGAPNGVAFNWIQTSPYGAANDQYIYAISDVLTVAPVIVADGGLSQECAADGGTAIAFSVTLPVLPPNDQVADIEWLLDGVSEASGETSTIFVPLGVHSVEAVVTTVLGLVFRTEALVEIADTVAPVVSLSIEGTVGQFLQVRVSASDACDPDPAAEAIAGAVVTDGDVFKAKLNKGELIIEGNTAVVRGFSTDSSGNVGQAEEIIPTQ